MFAAIAAAFLSSAMSPDTALTTGSSAPTIEKTTGGNINLKGEKETVISFWSPKDPLSRINNKNNSEKYSDGSVEYISVCIDSDDSLAHEVLHYDGTELNGNHLLYSDVNSRVFKDYGVENAPKTFHINPQGKITRISI